MEKYLIGAVAGIMLYQLYKQRQQQQPTTAQQSKTPPAVNGPARGYIVAKVPYDGGCGQQLHTSLHKVL